MDPKTPVSKLAGIGQYYSYKLKKLEIETVEDLIYHFPFRYDDFSKIEHIENVTPGQKLSIQGNVWQIKNIRTRGGKFVTVATVADQSGVCEIIWFNQPYLTKIIKPGTFIALSGKAEIEGKRLKLISPSYEILRAQAPVKNEARREAASPKLETEALHTGRLVPVYPETAGITSKWLRTKIAKILPLYLNVQKDFMPAAILGKHQLIDLQTALNKIHFPRTYQEVTDSRNRLSFDELFLFQFLSARRRRDWQQQKHAPAMKVKKTQIADFIEKLPFELTAAQHQAASQIIVDLQRSIPTNRLLEGDVGSGKTVVAALAAYVAFLNGFDSLLAAPTEILAFQHQKTLESLLSNWGIDVGIWTGSKKIKGPITCGTHALLTTFRPLRQIGLVVVDEQHRFGVAQRAKLFLEQTAKLTPHLLTMTATPIPRTLALTLYGDLDLSVLDEMPKGRQKIATFVVPNSKRNDAYKFIEKQTSAGRQAFIITPFVEPSETMATVKAAVDEFAKLKSKFSPKVKLGLLHGRLKSKEKEAIINDFKAAAIHVLVTTPVVEVGIDVPNASVMMIESAERFGLAQLHQLRGRVGRGQHKSYCLLFTESQSENSLRRLKSMEKVHVGFELSEIDLKMRGPGEVFGLKQSGFANLKIANLSDEPMVAKAQAQVKILMDADPKLKTYPLLRRKVESLQQELAQPN